MRNDIIELLSAAGYDYAALINMTDSRLSELLSDVEYLGKE